MVLVLLSDGKLAGSVQAGGELAGSVLAGGVLAGSVLAGCVQACVRVNDVSRGEREEEVGGIGRARVRARQIRQAAFTILRNDVEDVRGVVCSAER